MNELKMRFCCVCGKELGMFSDRYYDRSDTCGKRECERVMRDMEAQERDEAHQRLDDDRGWS